MKDLKTIIESNLYKISSQPKWDNAYFLPIKQASTSDKGRFGQSVFVDILTEIGYNAVIENNGIGDYDVKIRQLPTNIRVEVKTATIDVGGSFQFNSIKKGNYMYDYVFCLGISYNELYYDFISKDFVEKTLTTNMTTEGGGFKYTTKLDRQLTFGNLEETLNHTI